MEDLPPMDKDVQQNVFFALVGAIAVGSAWQRVI